MTFSDPQPPVPPEASAEQEPSSIPAFPAQPISHEQDIPEDIRTPWGGGELWLLFGFAVGSLFVMQLALAAFMIVHFHLTTAQLAQRLQTDAPLAVGFQAAWYVVLLAFLAIVIRVYHGAPLAPSLRWSRLRPRAVSPSIVYLTCIFGGFALAFAVNAASQVIGEKKHLPIENLFGTRTDILWLMFFGILIAPFVEETIFRGFLYPVFARKWGIPAGIIITGVLFGGIHAAQLWGGWAQIALLIFVGIVLTFARARTGTVLASYLIHLSYNSFLFLGFYFGTHGLKHIPPIH